MGRYNQAEHMIGIVCYLASQHAQHSLCGALQVIMALGQPDSVAIPSGRGVATHGACLPDGNIEAKIKDSTPTWRSVLSTGEVTQAYK